MALDAAAHPAFARFQVLQELVTEAGHETLLARSKTGTLVAIPILIRAPIPTEMASALSREGSQAARLVHDAIVQTRALLLEEELAALVTEFIPGVSLQRLLRFASARSVRLPDDAAWYVIERLLAALTHAHSQKDASGGQSPILHSGVSPSSVIVGWDGTVKARDFASARMRAIVAPLRKRAEPSETPAVVAPEQASGGSITAQTDVFCAALVAWRIATGRTPYARFRKSAAQMLIAMSEGDLARFEKTRPDLPAPVRVAFQSALEPDPAKRTIGAQELLDVVRAYFNASAGKESLAKLLERWREQLEQSVTPWERRASIPDAREIEADAKEVVVPDGALALAMPEDRPSIDALVATPDEPDEPWNKDEDALPREEVALAATDAKASLSRVGSVAPDALHMSAPKVRITSPSLPVYGGDAVNIPRPIAKKQFFSGGVAAATVFAVFVLLIVATVMLLKWLSGPA
ncbi:MAG: protein kinase [Labilithrix sp.]|nr:protein kinase [Labilithrix sp.]